MIRKIFHKDNVVKIEIDTNIGWYVTLNFDQNTELQAILLRDSIQEKFGNVIESIRKEAYEQGWDDKTKRKPKQTWFKRWL